MTAPLGNANSANGKEWKLAIKRALAHRGQGDFRKALDTLAVKFLEACDKSDPWALLELANRFDGRSAQAVHISGGEDEEGNALPVPTTAVITLIKPDGSSTQV